MMLSANDILNKWVTLTNELNVPEITNLYSSDAQLLPTFSSKALVGTEPIRGYFKRFTTHSKVTVTLHPNSITIRKMSDTVNMASGLYCWEIDMDDELLNFEARFSMVIVPGDEHPIKHHHSSQIPRSI